MDATLVAKMGVRADFLSPSEPAFLYQEIVMERQTVSLPG